jgi:hypothetical protein
MFPYNNIFCSWCHSSALRNNLTKKGDARNDLPLTSLPVSLLSVERRCYTPGVEHTDLAGARACASSTPTREVFAGIRGRAQLDERVYREIIALRTIEDIFLTSIFAEKVRR